MAPAPEVALCGAAHLPVHHGGVPLGVLTAALVLAGLCLLPTLLLLRRPAPGLIAAAVLVPAVLAGTQLLAPRVDLAELSQAMEASD